MMFLLVYLLIGLVITAINHRTFVDICEATVVPEQVHRVLFISLFISIIMWPILAFAMIKSLF